MATLVIGIGTSGLGVLEAAQQFNYEFLDKNTPDDVEYVFVDTEATSSSKSTPLGNTGIKKIPIPLNVIQASVAALRENKDFVSTWFPTKIEIDADVTAASGRPTYGRLGLWVYYNDIKNLLQNFSLKQGQKNVLVVGSLTGGTGSGICIDLAYIIRHFIMNADLNAVFMIPSYSAFNQTNKVIFENSYQALRSIEFYSLKENKYSMKTPDGIDISSNKPPYDLISVVSQDYDQNSVINASGMRSLEELITSVGLYVSCLFIDNPQGTNLKGLIDSRRTDAIAANNHMLFFSSFGISMAQYPQRLLEEYIALDYSSEVVGFWKDSSLQNDKSINIAKSNIDKHISIAIEDILNISIKNKPLIEFIDVIINEIVEKKYGGYPDANEYLDSLFSTQNGSLYLILSNNVNNARAYLIKSINSDLNHRLKDEPRLTEGELFLKSISDYLNPSINGSLTKFWADNYKINGSPNTWLNLYKFLKDKLFSGRALAKLFIQDHALIKERLEDIIKVLKMNLLYPDLIKISNCITNNAQHIIADGEKLINTHDLNELKKTLSDLLSNNLNVSFASRKSYIRANNSNFAQVFYYYTNGNFDDEVANLERSIDAQGNSIDVSGKSLLNGLSLIDFLTEKNSLNPKSIQFLYNRILKDIVGDVKGKLDSIGNINANIFQLIGSNNNPINTYLKANPNKLSESPPAFMAHSHTDDTRGVFSFSPCLKQLYTLENVNLFNQNNLSPNNTVTSANPNQNAIELPCMKNTIVMYREYSYYGNFGGILNDTLIPTRDIKSLSIIKDAMKLSMNNEDFIMNRLPYFNQYRKANQSFDLKHEFEKIASHDTSK